jgi:hypothetical protein
MPMCKTCEREMGTDLLTDLRAHDRAILDPGVEVIVRGYGPVIIQDSPKHGWLRVLTEDGRSRMVREERIIWEASA